MVKLGINLLRWSNPWDEIHRCIAAVLESDFKNFALQYMENPNDAVPSLVEEVKLFFGNDERIRIIRNETNLGYAGGHNKFFAKSSEPLLMVLNPDAILAPSFLRSIEAVFANPMVGAATGKMLKPADRNSQSRILDGTGLIIFPTGRAKERGQNEIDHGQYDEEREVFGVSGTAAVYRKSALNNVAVFNREYFDVDFFAYWEDLDLSWRLQLAGYDCVYVPEAIVEHGRAVGAHPGGIRDFRGFIKHHQQIPPQIRRWSWRNHIFSIIKNGRGWGFWRNLPRIIAREIGMLLFIFCFTPSTFGAIPEFFRLLPAMLRKRRQIAGIVGAVATKKTRASLKSPFIS